MTELNLIVIRSKDMNKLASFYGILDIDFVQHRHDKGPEHFSAELGSIVFEIYPQRNDNDNTTNIRLGFTVNNIDKVLVDLINAGATIVSDVKDSPWGRRAVIDDPEGHRVESLEENQK